MTIEIDMNQGELSQTKVRTEALSPKTLWEMGGNNAWYSGHNTTTVAATERTMSNCQDGYWYVHSSNLWPAILSATFAVTPAKSAQGSAIKKRPTSKCPNEINGSTVRSPIKGLVGKFHSRSRIAVPPARKEAVEKYYHGDLTTHLRFLGFNASRLLKGAGDLMSPMPSIRTLLSMPLPLTLKVLQ